VRGSCDLDFLYVEDGLIFLTFEENDRFRILVGNFSSQIRRAHLYIEFGGLNSNVY